MEPASVVRVGSPAIAADTDSVVRTIAAVVQHAAELRTSGFWKCVQQSLGAEVTGLDGGGSSRARPEELVCYGLGQLDTVNGSNQLSLLTLLIEELGLSSEHVFQDYLVMRSMAQESSRFAGPCSLYYGWLS